LTLPRLPARWIGARGTAGVHRMKSTVPASAPATSMPWRRRSAGRGSWVSQLGIKSGLRLPSRAKPTD
jgi:hypothetical protein